MKRKVIVFLLLSILMIFNLVGCDTLDSLNTVKGFEHIAEEDVPADYKGTGTYYYNKTTGVVYIVFDRSAVKLESADYEFYIYDKQNNEFIGYNH